MDGWIIGLIATLVIGSAVILYGALADRRRHRRSIAELLSPPRRTIPNLAADSPTPRYISALQAKRPPPGGERPALSDPERDRINEMIKGTETTTIKIGYASDGFVTDRNSGRAILDHPRVLTSAEPIMTIRELIGVIEHMITDGSPLVIVAPSMAPDVLDTLEVNHIQRKIDLVAVLTRDPVPVDKIVAATGAQLISRVDLQTGYLADADLGRCRLWVSDSRRTHIVAEQAPQA
jgi:hypothetical protein